MSIPGDKPFQPPQSPQPVAPSFRILIVDDDPALRRTFPHVLAQPGRSFDEAASIGEAIARLDQGFD